MICAGAWGLAGNPINNTYRLVHGEGDNLPGLIIDVYDHTAVMQAHSAGMHVYRMEIAEALSEVMGDVVQNIYYKSETTLPFKAVWNLKMVLLKEEVPRILLWNMA